MEKNDIGTISNPAIALERSYREKEPRGTLVIKSQLDAVNRKNDAIKLRANSLERREEGAKNLADIREKLVEISDLLSKDLESKSKSLKFSVDESTNRMLVTVLDKETGKVIKQIPSERLLKVAHSLAALKGILYDEKY
jgi:flagellar protein FlaG